MSDVTVDGCRLSYTVDGAEDAPVVLLSHSLGTTRALWEPQLDRLRQSFRVVRYDARGHGGSQVMTGDYRIDQLGRDALGVLDAVGARRAHVCGVSLGGLVALWLGVHAPERVNGLVAANTAARLATSEIWQQRIETVRSEGMAGVVDVGLTRWFTEAFRRDQEPTVERFRRMLARCAVDGYAGSCAALRDADLTADVARIEAPLLVVTGTHDIATPPAAGRLVHEKVRGSHYCALAGGHLGNVEQAEAFSTEVGRFLATIPSRG